MFIYGNRSTLIICLLSLNSKLILKYIPPKTYYFYKIPDLKTTLVLSFNLVLIEKVFENIVYV